MNSTDVFQDQIDSELLNKNEEGRKEFFEFLSNDLSKQLNISNVKLGYDAEDNQKTCLFTVKNIDSKDISDLHLKVRELAYYYAKENDLLDYYNELVFILGR